MSLTTLDLTSEARTYSSEPLPPLRPIWIGFVLAFGFLAAEIGEAVIQARSGSASEINVLTGLVSIVGWIYWLSCVHRFHLVLSQMAPYVAGQSTYPITPGRAVGYHFLPFYNLYWIFKWPSTLSNYLRQDLAVDIMAGGALGLLLLLGMLLTRLFDGFLGFLVIFLIGLYISRKLRPAMEEHERMRGAAQVFT